MRKEWRALADYRSDHSCRGISCTFCPFMCANGGCLSMYAMRNEAMGDMSAADVRDYVHGWEYMICQGDSYLRNLQRGIKEYKAIRVNQGVR